MKEIRKLMEEYLVDEQIEYLDDWVYKMFLELDEAYELPTL